METKIYYDDPIFTLRLECIIKFYSKSMSQNFLVDIFSLGVFKSPFIGVTNIL